ncbi:uncharacterized protein LOC131631499 [Vicia villosa]|uniref:uncharacterized protein LOC131631499 n=1 Tax=Vicia villosa TaxID=3911 RepID=UPI00273BCCB0|nr:uncharacterized protein LOC131631499 [Vicia villosa]
MENHSNSRPNSRDSSPTSRELLENDHRSSFDEPPPSNTKRVKLICSFGGKIQPRLHDGHFSYIGGDTKILAVDRNVKLSHLIGKLNAMADSHVCFKYQLPGEDLDALISVCNEDDLDYMMIEYDRMCRASPKPARLRIFLFPSPVKNHSSNASFDSINSAMNLAEDSKSEGKWFVDALNSVHVPPSEDSSPPPPPPTMNPDYLFGLDKPYSPSPEAKQAEFPESVPDFAAKDAECESETVRETEIHEIQVMQTVNDEHQVNSDGENGGVNGSVGCYSQENTETETPLVSTVPVQAVSDEQLMNSDEEKGGVNGCVDSHSQVNTETEIPLVTTPPVQAVNEEQQMNSDGENGGVNCYTQENTETEMPLVTTELPAQPPAPVHSSSVQFLPPGPASVQSSFSPMMPNVVSPYSTGYPNEPIPVYLIQTASGLYQAVRPVIGPNGQPVYFAYTQIGNEFGYNASGLPGMVSERGYSNGSYRQGFPSQAAVAGVDSWN